MSELRMTEVSGGVVQADRDSITINVPYAMGLVCGSTLTTITAILMPVDSTIVSTAGMSGVAVRLGFMDTQRYRYVAATSLTGGGRSVCTAAQIDPIATAAWRPVVIPAGLTLLTAPHPGVPMFLYQQIRYVFDESAALPGTRALWRRTLATNTSDEIGAPFHDDARFRFFVGNSADAADDAPVDLASLRGVQIVMDAESARPPSFGAQRDRASLQTSVFFRNRVD
jgi:hypothetical protein